MRLQDLPKFIEINIDEALEERFMESEELYIRFLRKLEAANDLVVVEELIPEMSEGEHSNLGTIAFAIGFSLMMVLDVVLG